MQLIRVSCKTCETPFYICRCCYRGQKYCCKACRVLGYRECHKKAQRRYRRTEKGKKAHREAENRRRQRLLQKQRKKLDDKSSTPASGYSTRGPDREFFGTGDDPGCRFCGRSGVIVPEFPRRGYGKRRFEPAAMEKAA